jgi:Putative periplasmic protein kinase ArgK and related GTPases of G3E family
MMKDKNHLSKRRKEQARNWMHETVKHNLEERFYNSEKIKNVLNDVESDVVQGKTSSSAAAKRLLDIYFKKFS